VTRADAERCAGAWLAGMVGGPDLWPGAPFLTLEDGTTVQVWDDGEVTLDTGTELRTLATLDTARGFELLRLQGEA
jgi:hypothetical protein